MFITQDQGLVWRIKLRQLKIWGQSIVFNHFDKYPLITFKLADYLLFKQVVGMIQLKILQRMGLKR